MGSSRISTYILHAITSPPQEVKQRPSVIRIWGVLDPRVYATVSDKEAVSHIAIGDNFSICIKNAMLMAFDKRAQWFKVMQNQSQEPFADDKRLLVYYSENCWALNMKVFTKAAMKLFPGKKEDYWKDLVIEPQYVGIGRVYDICHIMGYKMKELPTMDIHDAQIYIARWGGQPEMEKFERPYNLKS